MNFKIDTKEKFTVITPLQFHLSANLTAELNQIATNCLQTDIKNVVFNMKEVVSLDEAAATNLKSLQQSFYESNTSFVICEMQTAVSEKLELNAIARINECYPNRKRSMGYCANGRNRKRVNE
jgi:anti-anti-sigma regulatory factor